MSNNCPDEIDVNGTKYVKANLTAPATGPRGPIVVARTLSAGVWVGELVSEVPNPGGTARVVLANAKRVRYWYGANETSRLATIGCLPKSTILPVVAEQTLTQVIEYTRATEVAVKTFEPRNYNDGR